jgi:hypothetical protein
MPTNHRQIPIREKILGLYYNDFQTDAPCTDSQIPALAIENSLFSSPVEKVGLGRVDGFDQDESECESHKGAVVLRGFLAS